MTRHYTPAYTRGQAGLARYESKQYLEKRASAPVPMRGAAITRQRPWYQVGNNSGPSLIRPGKGRPKTSARYGRLDEGIVGRNRDGPPHDGCQQP